MTLPLACFSIVCEPDWSRKQLFDGDEGEFGGSAMKVVAKYSTTGNVAEYLHGVEAFTCPSGARRVTAALRPAPAFHSWTMTDADGQLQWGYTRTYYFSADTEGEYEPHTLTIVSLTNMRRFFARLLVTADAVVHYSEPATLVLVAEELSKVLSTPAPAPGASVSACLPGQAPISATNPGVSDLPLADTTFGTLTSHLDSANIIRALAAVLGERRMVFVSDHMATLTPAITDLRSLLYPLTWPHIFVPVLPCSLMNFLAAPMPYIMGVVRGAWACCDPADVGDAVVVDLDNNTVRAPPPGATRGSIELLDTLPRRYVMRLARVVVRSTSNLHFELWPSRPDTMPTTTTKEGPTVTLRSLEALYASDSEGDFLCDLENIETQAAAARAEVILEEEDEEEYEYEDEDEEDEEGEGEGRPQTPATAPEPPAPHRSSESAPTPRTGRRRFDPASVAAAVHDQTPLPSLLLLPDGEAVAHDPAIAIDPSQFILEDIINSNALRRGFLSLFTSLFKTFWNYIRPLNDASVTDNTGFLDRILDRKAMTLEAKADAHEFVEELLQTQLVAFFVQCRVLGDTNGASAEEMDIFDSIIMSKAKKRDECLSYIRSTPLNANAFRRGRGKHARFQYRYLSLKDNILSWCELPGAAQKNDQKIVALTIANDGAVNGELLARPSVKDLEALRSITIDSTYKISFPSNRELLKSCPTAYPLQLDGPDGTTIIAFHDGFSRRIWIRAINTRIHGTGGASRQLLTSGTVAFNTIVKQRKEQLRKVGGFISGAK